MRIVPHILSTLFFVLLCLPTKAQESAERQRDPIFLLPGVYPAVIVNGDTLAHIWLPEFIKFAPLQFRNAQEQAEFNRLVRDVRRTLPYAKLIARIIIETYEYMETLPDEEARQRHLNQMERYLRNTYTPRMRQLTRAQGQMMMLLIDRETNSSSFHIIQATMGRAQAVAANMLARFWGNNLRTRFDPHGNSNHRMIEMIAVMIEQGAL